MKNCVFCQIAAGTLPAWRVYEDEAVVAFFDKAPVAEYHTLVIPKRHAADIFEVPDEDVRALASAIRQLTLIYRNKLGLKALQIVSSNGKEAQQDVFHLHFHIVPRSEGDGQDIAWSPEPGIPARFDALLARLSQPSS